MAEYVVDTGRLRDNASAIAGLQRDLDAIAVRLGAMQLGSILKVKASTALVAQIGDCKWAVAHQSDDMGRLARGLEQLAELYDTCEQELKNPKTQAEKDKEVAAEKENEEKWWDKWLPDLSDIVKWLGSKCVPLGFIYGLDKFFEGPSGHISGVKSLISAIGNGTKAIFGSGKASWLEKGSKFFGFYKQDVGGLSDSYSKWLKGMKIGKNATVAENVAAGCKWAGYALSFVGEFFDNKDEYEAGGMSTGRFAAETVIEGAVDVGLSIGAGILVAAALPASAPAIVVGAVGAGVVWLADTVVENLSGQDIDEWVSDIVIDGGKAITGAAKDLGKAVGKGVRNGAKAIGKWAKGLFS